MRAIMVGCGHVSCDSISRNLIVVRPFVLYVTIVIVGDVGSGSSCIVVVSNCWELVSGGMSLVYGLFVF